MKKWNEIMARSKAKVAAIKAAKAKGQRTPAQAEARKKEIEAKLASPEYQAEQAERLAKAQAETLAMNVVTDKLTARRKSYLKVAEARQCT
jgi:hypothetical protein